ncbi:nuclear transport factor 2 family protein [Lacinutrix chionoecetis]
MKKLILLVSLCWFLFNCQDNAQRYTQDSKEIEIVKKTIAHYDLHQWDSLVMNYADTAKVYYNTRTAILGPKDLKTFLTRNDNYISTRAFEDESREYEMIEDNNGKVWVNFWGLWKGNLKENNKGIVIPVHITYQFDNDKIVEEFGYWNAAELVKEIQAIENAKLSLEDIEAADDL